MWEGEGPEFGRGEEGEHVAARRLVLGPKRPTNQLAVFNRAEFGLVERARLDRDRN